jgi:hypothetical protein
MIRIHLFLICRELRVFIRLPSSIPKALWVFTRLRSSVVGLFTSMRGWVGVCVCVCVLHLSVYMCLCFRGCSCLYGALICRAEAAELSV